MKVIILEYLDKTMVRKITLFTLFLLLSCGGSSTRMNNIRLFKETPVWKLAKYVEKNDVEEISSFIKENPNLIDYQERNYGATVLYWAMYNSDPSYNEYFESARTLIELGANPFIEDQEEDTPFYRAAMFFGKGSNYVELCLKSSHFNRLSKEEKDTILGETLIRASNKLVEDIESVKLLIEYGANINYINSDSTKNPLMVSATSSNFPLTKYFIEKGADYSIELHSPLGDDFGEFDLGTYNVVDVIRNKYIVKNKYYERNIKLKKELLDLIKSKKLRTSQDVLE